MMTRDAAMVYGKKIGCRYYVYNDAGGLLGGYKNLKDAETLKAEWEARYKKDKLNKRMRVIIKATKG